MGAAAEYDVIVVGARVAGSVLALSLAERGHRILLLDRAAFPSDTLSTHFFRAPALRAFQQVGVLDQILEVAPHLTVNYNVIDGLVFPEPVDRPEDFPFYMCVRRITLDKILTDRIRASANIDFREGAKVERLLEGGGRVNGVAWRSEGGPHEARARVVVGADGIRSSLASWLQPKVEQSEPVNRAMYYAYYRDFEPNDGPAAEFHFRGDNLVYCFPCDGDLTLLAASVPIALFGEFKRDPVGRLDQELKSMVALAPRLKKASLASKVQGTGSIGGHLRVPFGPGWVLVGDAAMAMDPWSGQGIDQATTHARFLATELHSFLSGKAAWDQTMNSYHIARNEFSLKTFNRTCTNSRDLTKMTKAALESRGLSH
jgi:2-polyprenyl-6-methoxyphenol hydroxylase-like FAD-dependent oxidoreductase